MKFAAYQYNHDPEVVRDFPPPIKGVQLEEHPFGLPPTEIRPIWIVDVSSLDDLVRLAIDEDVCLDLFYSEFWSGESLQSPGERLFSIGLYDNVG